MALMLWAAPAQAREMAGVRMPDSLSLEGRSLSLAHMDLEEKFFFKVYVWSLYLEQKPRAKSEAISANCVKRLQFRFLRKVSRAQLVDAFEEGLASNPALRGGAMRQELDRLLGSLKDVPEGGELVITYVPGGGLRVSGEASHGLSVAGKTFADALFVSWLDQHPVFKT
nr:chalcone isomerase family protein [Archangium primigenium]